MTVCTGCGARIRWWHLTIIGPGLNAGLPTPTLLDVTRDDRPFHNRCASAYTQGIIDGMDRAEDGDEA